MKRIVHITPTLPPAINGLGDFSQLISQSISDLYPSEQLFLVVSKPHGYSADNVTEFNAGNLYSKLSEVRPDAVILHYVGYAYQLKGLPFFMPKALKKIKDVYNCKILVYFHELYATSSNFLSTAFYTSYLQKTIVKQLYAVADQTFTNCVLYKGILSAALKSKLNTVIVTGLCSNIPEAYYDAHVGKEATSMVVFGSQTSRSAIYGSPYFNKVVNDAGIKTIYDIGAGTMNYNSSSIYFQALGKLPAEEIAPYLNKATYGAYDYAPHIIGKSGILSAYAAYGVIPVNFSQIKEKVLDGLTPEKEYYDTTSALPVNNIDAARNGLQGWYKQRNQKSIASNIIQHL